MAEESVVNVAKSDLLNETRINTVDDEEFLRNYTIVDYWPVNETLPSHIFGK